MLAPPLCATVRQDIQPLLADTETRVAQLLANQSNEISTNVYGKLQMALRAVQTIQVWMDTIMRTPAPVPTTARQQAMAGHMSTMTTQPMQSMQSMVTGVGGGVVHGVYAVPTIPPTAPGRSFSTGSVGGQMHRPS